MLDAYECKHENVFCEFQMVSNQWFLKLLRFHPEKNEKTIRKGVQAYVTLFPMNKLSVHTNFYNSRVTAFRSSLPAM